MPVYTVSPDGRGELAPDFAGSTIAVPATDTRGFPIRTATPRRRTMPGIWKIDMKTGESKLLITFAEIAAVPWEMEGGYGKNAKSWFNHLLFNQDGSRFIFLHRWRAEGEPISVLPHAHVHRKRRGRLDHLHHRSERLQLALCLAAIPATSSSSLIIHRIRQRYYLFTDKTREVEAIGPEVMTVNGHNAYCQARTKSGC